MRELRVFGMAVVVAALVACDKKSEPAHTSGAPPATPAVAALPAGPVPIKLAQLPPAQLRPLAHAGGFLVIDASGKSSWGRHMVGPTPYQATSLARDEFAFDHVVQTNGVYDDVPHFRSTSTIETERDSYATLTHDDSTEVVILADAAAPARIAMDAGIQAFGWRAIALAAGAANTAVPYRFGAEPWEYATRADLTLRLDHLDALAGQHPQAVLLELTDDAKTSELIAALGALGQAGVPRVRLHRMMGWGAIGPSEIVDLRGIAAEDDEIVQSEPAKVEIGPPRIDGPIDSNGVETALATITTRFRYCFEKRLLPKLRGKLELAFDVDASGAISHASAKGLDAKIASCVAGAIFDLDITPLAIQDAGHVAVGIAFNAAEPPAPAPAPVSGFWCFEVSDAGLCAREEDQCDAARTGFVQTNAAVGDQTVTPPCKAQRTAWTSDGEHFAPTRKLCGATCRQAR